MPGAVGGRYILHEPLGSGGTGTVYRATDRLTGSFVALKRVKIPDSAPGSSTGTTRQSDVLRLTLANEFQVLASLRHPNIIGVLDYGFDNELQQRQPYFTMEYLAGAQTILQAGAGQPLRVQVGLLIQVLQALAYLHRHGILHRDLKPGNVLVTGTPGDGGSVAKVLDFGLSMARDQATGVAGTIAYMAPEVLAGRPADEAADLYSLGVMAFELLAGRHPFDTSDMGRLLLDILHTQPPLDAIGDRATLNDVLACLLDKEPARRWRDAEACIAALSRAAGLPPPPESVAIRESYLQAARFVGREAELDRLAAALDEALAGRGSLWLVGGESGVGKSRLLDELRTYALVAGVLVLRGQGVAGGGLAYQYWRDPLRRLALSTDLTDLELAILKPIFPDLGSLLERRVADAPALAGDAGRQRLLDTIVGVFGRQQVPALLILEDLQWGAESLDVLEQLSRVLGSMPLLVVGSYSDDEAPELPRRLPAARVIRLARLSGAEIEALSVSMLGEAGCDGEILGLLQRESEGNTFFLVEVARALAEEAGRLSDIAGMTLPRRVFPRGMQTLISRRLARVPDKAHALLRAAAVLGRQIDVQVLARLTDGIRLDDWLTVCANAAVLEVSDGQWRFAHDKLREGLLASLDVGARTALHCQAALAVEAAYPARPERAAELAYHWRMAHDVDRERRYVVQAAGQAADHFANAEALEHLGRALELVPASDLAERYALFLAREQVYDLIGRRDAQTDDLASLESLAAGLGPARQAEVALRRAQYAYVQADYPAALAATQAALHMSETARDLAQTAAGYLQWGMILYRQADYGEARLQFERARVLAREAGLSQVEADSLRGLGNVSIDLGDYDAVRDYYEQALQQYARIGDRRGEGKTLNNLGNLWFDLGRYAESKSWYEQSLRIWRQTGYRFSESLTLINMGMVWRMLGDCGRAEDCLRQALAIKREIGDRSGEGFALTHLGHALAGLQRLDEAAAVYRLAVDIRRELGEHNLAMESLAGLARLAQAQTEPARALECVEAILAHLDSGGAVDGAEEPLWVYLSCYRVLQAGGDPRAAAVLAAAAAQLQQRADRIADDELRRSFLENVPYHVEIARAVDQGRIS